MKWKQVIYLCYTRFFSKLERRVLAFWSECEWSQFCDWCEVGCSFVQLGTLNTSVLIFVKWARDLCKLKLDKIQAWKEWCEWGWHHLRCPLPNSRGLFDVSYMLGEVSVFFNGMTSFMSTRLCGMSQWAIKIGLSGYKTSIKKEALNSGEGGR